MWGQPNSNSREGNTDNNVHFVFSYDVLFKSKQYSDFSETLGQVAEFDNLPIVSANTTKSE